MAGEKGTCLLLPGFLGSELTMDFGSIAEALGLNSVWLSPARLASGRMADLKFAIASDGTISGEDTRLRDGSALKSYYGLVGVYLAKQGWNVATVNADWRRPLTYDTNAALLRIKGLEDEWPLVILAHSRGGLIARQILGALKGAGMAGAIKRVVAVGTPHTGSMNAVTLFAGFHSLLRTLVKIGRLLGPDYFSGLLPKVVYATVRSWPSGYELLPAPGAPWLKNATAATFYDPATYAGSPMEPIPALLANVPGAWSIVPPVPDGFDWTDGLGVGVNTPNGLIEDGPVESADDLTYTTSGDGTVVSGSAAQASRRQFTFPCVHDMLLSDGRAWPVIDSALSGELTDALTVIAGEILQSG
jgi:hypothetical protein